MVSTSELDQSERLPWLEINEDFRTRRARSWGPIVAVLLGLLALFLVIGGIWYTQHAAPMEADGELIAAPPGDYKVRAPGDDGMQVGNESDAMLAASEGQEASARIAPGARALGPSTIAVPAGTVPADAPPTPASTPVASSRRRRGGPAGRVRQRGGCRGALVDAVRGAGRLGPPAPFRRARRGRRQDGLPAARGGRGRHRGGRVVRSVAEGQGRLLRGSVTRQ